MAELKLNKPLYSDGGGSSTPPRGDSPGGGGAQQPPQRPPRPPRPPLWMKVAALGIDLLLLHGAALLVLKLAFPAVVSLGLWGPFVGLAVSALYFTIGYSSITEGRTIGKLVLRLQVADPVRSVLGSGQALLRSLLLVWPLVVYAAISLQVERMADPKLLAPQPMLIQMAGFAVAAAWYVGNFFHAWFDPHGRTWIDRLARSVEISTEASDEEIQGFLRSARESADPARSRRALTALVVTVVAIVALDAALSYMLLKQFRILTDAQRAEMLRERESVAVPGFPLPIQMAPEEEPTGVDDETTRPVGVQFQYRRRTPFTPEEVKGVPEALTAVDRITSAVASAISHKARESTATIQGMPPQNEKAKVQVGFAQYGDLFFAGQAVNVYSEGRTLDLEQIRREALQQTTAPATTTTETVPAADPAPPTTSPVTSATTETTASM